MSQALGRLLTALGWRPLLFPSAEALLNSGMAKKAAIFLLDVRLLGASGPELGSELSAMGFRAPIVYMSAHDSPRVSGERARPGRSAFLAKPFNAQQLAGALSQLLERS